jgi:hypothetical protein
MQDIPLPLFLTIAPYMINPIKSLEFVKEKVIYTNWAL